MTTQTFSPVTRFAMRATFLYLVFYVYPYGFEYIYAISDREVFSFWPSLTVPFAKWFFGWEIDMETTRNGFDSMYDFSRFALIGLMALVGSAIWMLIERSTRRTVDGWLWSFTRTLLRYHVGFTLIMYGVAKVVPIQFGSLDLNTMETTLGEQTGMQFLWNFMSYSRFYAGISGWIEVIGGILLLFRRTTLAGAVLTAIAMTNVVLLDIGYDVSVKMFAVHLFLMNLVILGPHYRMFWQVLIQQKAVAPTQESTRFTDRLGRAYLPIKGILLLAFAITSITEHRDILEQVTGGDMQYAQHIDVTLHVVNGDTLAGPDKNQFWKSITVSPWSYYPNWLQVKQPDNPYNYYVFTMDTVQQTIEFYPSRGDSTDLYQFQYREEENTVTWEGTHGTDTLYLEGTRKRLEDYRLSRAPMWVRDLKTD
ncbi:MAG TPA: hypothetical protein DCE41_08540 [Cytophagales bacterium]|nr:hypothetical protein [Cytophagales bacterium]HAA22978.1 hypothetical protein [Cytophagales bacterium]HAP57980.1 hypothetical protein [Cytophagales bacterium]